MYSFNLSDDSDFNGNEIIIPLDKDQKSPLFHFGYHVGKKSALTRESRRNILKIALFNEIIKKEIYSSEYIGQWGKSSSSRRLWRIAHQINISCKKSENLAKMEFSYLQWKDDLQWLKDEFYNKYSFSFSWPE